VFSLCFQGMHIECGNLDFARPRYKCGFCKAVVANLPNKPIPVFTRVKRSQDPPNKEFSRKVLENLTFNMSSENFEIKIHMYKDRKNVKEPEIATFQITGMPAVDIPNPVKVHKDVTESIEDKIKNIPCPFDDCCELISRLQFKEHCRQHREGKEIKTDEEIQKDKENETEEQEESHIDEGNHKENIVEETNENITEGNEDSAPIEGFLELVTSPLKTLTPGKQENSDTKKKKGTSLSGPPSKKRKMNNSASKMTPPGEKQSSILKFFQKFSPKFDTEKHPPKKEMKKVQTCPESPSLRLSNSPLKSLVEKENKLATPEKKVISSPIGYFKVDEEISIKTPVKNFNERIAQFSDKAEIISNPGDDFVCKICRDVFGDTISLERHKASHKTKFICQFCKFTFTNIISWKTHENSHRGVSYECPICEEKFTSEKMLATHTKKTHMGREGDEKIETLKNIHFCEFCDYSTKYKGNVKKHTNIKHKEKSDNASEASETSEFSETKSVVVVKSPPEQCAIIDISDTDEETEVADQTEKNTKVENILNDWD